jgi:hypothetical protein
VVGGIAFPLTLTRKLLKTGASGDARSPGNKLLEFREFLRGKTYAGRREELLGRKIAEVLEEEVDASSALVRTPPATPSKSAY